MHHRQLLSGSMVVFAGRPLQRGQARGVLSLRQNRAGASATVLKD